MSNIVATTLQVRRGWNYIGIHFDEIYEFTYVNMYHRSEEHTTSPYYDKFEIMMPGYWRPAARGGFEKHDDVIILGCKSYQRLNHEMTAKSTWKDYPADVTYGFCL